MGPPGYQNCNLCDVIMGLAPPKTISTKHQGQDSPTLKLDHLSFYWQFSQEQQQEEKTVIAELGESQPRIVTCVT